MITKESILKNAEKVNDYWISRNPESGDCAWERACYFSGCLDAYRLLGKKEYLDYAVKWANDNNWSFYEHKNPILNNLTCADNLLCGETYLDLIYEFNIPGDVQSMIKTLEYNLNDKDNDYWLWVDFIHMALNFYNRAAVCLDMPGLSDKAHRLYLNSKIERKCFDSEYNLWFRDEDFLPDKKRNADNKKIFWSRGNGWVFAGLAKTLSHLSQDNRYYNEYLSMFRKMAEAIRALQLEDGFWHSDLLSPQIFDMPEVSGTALFTFGMLRGINMGVLGDEYKECALKGYEAITNTALDNNGHIGWVQGVALAPGIIEKECTKDYAVGSYLKICYELSNMI